MLKKMTSLVTVLTLCSCAVAKKSDNSLMSMDPAEREALLPDVTRTQKAGRLLQARWHDGLHFQDRQFKPPFDAAGLNTDCPAIGGRYEVIPSSIVTQRNVRLYDRYKLRQIGCFEIALFPDPRGRELSGGTFDTAEIKELSLAWGGTPTQVYDDATQVVAPAGNDEFVMRNRMEEFTVDILSFIYPYWRRDGDGRVVGLKRAMRVNLRVPPVGIGRIEQQLTEELEIAPNGVLHVRHADHVNERRRGDIVDVEAASYEARFSLRRH